MNLNTNFPYVVAYYSVVVGLFYISSDILGANGSITRFSTKIDEINRK